MEYGFKTVRVRVSGLGPGRMVSAEFANFGGMLHGINWIRSVVPKMCFMASHEYF